MQSGERGWARVRVASRRAWDVVAMAGCLVAGDGAFAQTPPAAPLPASASRYAVVSLIGDELSLVTYQPNVGSNIDRNARQRIPIKDDDFDAAALNAADRAIHRVVPQATTSLLLVGRDQYAQASDVFDSRDALQTLVKSLGRDGDAATQPWLIVLAKHRGQVRLQTIDGTQGEGHLYGLGFFMDRFGEYSDLRTGEIGRGFLAPFAYLTVGLVDLRTGTVVRTRTVDESTMLTTTHSRSDTFPWDTYTADEKVRLVDGEIARAVDEAIPALIAQH